MLLCCTWSLMGGDSWINPFWCLIWDSMMLSLGGDGWLRKTFEWMYTINDCYGWMSDLLRIRSSWAQWEQCQRRFFSSQCQIQIIRLMQSDKTGRWRWVIGGRGLVLRIKTVSLVWRRCSKHWWGKMFINSHQSIRIASHNCHINTRIPGRRQQWLI